MHRLIIISTCLLLISWQASSQNATITGRVIEKSSGEGIPGVSILLNNTSVGTVTDIDGNYKLDIEPSENPILTFSFIGYEKQEVSIGSQSVINVSLATDYLNLDEVIVTAMNITQNKRGLNYAAQDVKGAEIAESQQQNFVNSLQGKIAGVQITSSSGSPGSSSSIVIRGGTSISENRDNAPLFVIDGIIMDNSTFAGSGNRAMDINPDDIESITVLKGPSAATLYGIDASNGAIIITTKSGKKGKVRVTFGSTVAFDRKFKTHEVQTTYGRGARGVYDDETSSMWGPAFTSSDKTYDNIGNFFKTGVQQKYDLSISGGSEKSTFFLSTSNNNQTGIVPGESYNRFNFMLKATTQMRDNLKVMASINTIFSDNIRGGSGSMRNVFTWPIDDDMSVYVNPNKSKRWLIDRNDDEQYRYNPENPYWTINNNLPEYNINRSISQLFFDWDVFPFLNVTQRVGFDRSNQYYKKVIVPESAGSITALEGQITEYEQSKQRITSTTIATYNKIFNNVWDVSVMSGFNVDASSSRRTNIVGTGFKLPNLLSINNVEKIDEILTNQNHGKRRLLSVFGEAKVDYKSIVSASITFRNDWTSTLPTSSNSFLYTTYRLGLVFTELFDFDLGGILSYGKIRANVASSGKDAPIESLTYTLRPYGGIGGGFNNHHTAGNPSLIPEFQTSKEVGLNLALFGGRFNVDVAYYNATATDMIIRSRVSSASGSIINTFNSGDVQNKGIELVLDAVILDVDNLKWNSSLNFSRNRSILLTLPASISRLPVTTGQIINEARPIALLNEPLYAIEGVPYLRNENGNVVIDEDGYPRSGTYAKDESGEYILNADGTRKISNDKVYLGNREPKFLLGITNTFTYKKINLSFLVDIRKGGDVINATASTMMSRGVHKLLDDYRNTTYTFEGEVETSEGFITNDQEVTLDESYFRFSGYRLVGENFVEDGSWVKLRYIAISYDFSTLVKKINMQSLRFTVTARNLFMWSRYSGGDPEKDYNGSAVGGAGTVGLDYFNVPTTQGITFGLKATF